MTSSFSTPFDLLENKLGVNEKNKNSHVVENVSGIYICIPMEYFRGRGRLPLQ